MAGRHLGRELCLSAVFQRRGVQRFSVLAHPCYRKPESFAVPMSLEFGVLAEPAAALAPEV